MIALDKPLLLAELAALSASITHPALDRLERLVSAAERAVPYTVAEQLYRALKLYGGHTHGLHVETGCAVCEAMRAWEGVK